MFFQLEPDVSGFALTADGLLDERDLSEKEKVLLALCFHTPIKWPFLSASVEMAAKCVEAMKKKRGCNHIHLGKANQLLENYYT